MTHCTPCCRNLVALLLLALLCLGGCATYTRQIVLRYDPITTTNPGSGDLYLVKVAEQPPAPSGAWPIGTIKNADNQIINTLWSGVSPAGLAQNALELELNRNGYQVIPQQAAPENANKVVEISEAAITLEQSPNISRTYVSCTIMVSLTVKKNGEPARKLHYEATGSDLAFKNRDQLAETLLRTTMQDLMKQAIPDIVRSMEQ